MEGFRREAAESGVRVGRPRRAPAGRAPACPSCSVPAPHLPCPRHHGQRGK